MGLVFRENKIKYLLHLRFCQEFRANGNRSVPRQDSGEKSTPD